MQDVVNLLVHVKRAYIDRMCSIFYIVVERMDDVMNLLVDIWHIVCVCACVCVFIAAIDILHILYRYRYMYRYMYILCIDIYTYLVECMEDGMDLQVYMKCAYVEYLLKCVWNMEYGMLIIMFIHHLFSQRVSTTGVFVCVCVVVVCVFQSTVEHKRSVGCRKMNEALTCHAIYIMTCQPYIS